MDDATKAPGDSTARRRERDYWVRPSHTPTRAHSGSNLGADHMTARRSPALVAERWSPEAHGTGREGWRHPDRRGRGPPSAIRRTRHGESAYDPSEVGNSSTCDRAWRGKVDAYSGISVLSDHRAPADLSLDLQWYRVQYYRLHVSDPVIYARKTRMIFHLFFTLRPFIIPWSHGTAV